MCDSYDNGLSKFLNDEKNMKNTIKIRFKVVGKK